MKCYYEVLGVARDVNDVDLKKAYRKLALKWHPDKNLDNAAEAKEQFQLVQQAYEVLSDPQERTWYDNHRESILRGVGSDYKDNSLDVFQYFTPSCFKGYGDDDKGFYSVYREVFNKIGTEDLEYVDEDSDFEIPSFGSSDSSYEEVVRHFYAYWQSYSTKKSYAWLDPYDMREAPNRRVGRAIEKENKKVRDKARKQRNEEVRNLVGFVRKRDKRVQEYVRLLEERALENAKKSQEHRKKIIRERQEAVKNYKESEWAKFSNMEKELETIEANLAAEFGESEESSHEELESDEEEVDGVVDSLYCVACNKVFKTAKAFENHENSKKHKENVEVLRVLALEEEERMREIDKNDDAEDSVPSDLEISSSSESIIEPWMNSGDYVKNVGIVEKQTKKKNKKQRFPNAYNASNSDLSDIEVDMTCGQSKKQRKKQRQNLEVQKKQVPSSDVEKMEVCADMNDTSESIEEENAKPSLKKGKGKKVKDVMVQNCSAAALISDNISVPCESNKMKNRKSKEKKDKKSDSVSSVQDTNYCCVTCHSEFPSKNKLFDHLKKTGHSVYIPHPKVTATKERVEQRGKGKGKKSK